MRLFIDQTLQLNKEITLDPFSSNYISRVLRLKIGNNLCLFNGQEPLGEYTGEISQLNKKQVQVKIKSFQEKNIESPLKISLLQGISRGDRMDYTIQKAIELGVNHIYPLFLERTNVKLTNPQRVDKKLSHWQGICQSALQQSGRTANVSIKKPEKLTIINEIKTELNLLADPQAKLKLSELVLTNKNNPSPTHINILIGPEGGLTDRERDYAISQNFTPISIGPRVLRTETAGLAIVSFLQTTYGDF